MINEEAFIIKQYLRDLLLILLLFALCFLFFGDVLRPIEGNVIFGLDLDALFFPIGKYAFERFRSGEIPFWNPYIFLGFPQYAEPQLSTFYPAMWLMDLMPIGTGYALLYATHFGLTASGGYVLVRQLGGRWSGAFLTGLVLAFNLFMVAHLHAGHLPHLMTIAYLPWLLASAIWAVKVGTWMATILAGVPLGLAMLAGYAPFFLFLVAAVSFVMIWLAFLTWQGNSLRSGLRILMQLVGIGLIAGLLAGVQLLPTVEFAKYSSRVAGADYEFASWLSMPFWNLLTLLMPDLYGTPLGDSDYWAPVTILTYWESAIYSGILAFLMFILAWALGEKQWRLWVLIGVGGLLIALGPAGAIHRLFYQLIPGFGLFRVPARMGYFYVLASAVLVGLMFDRWFDMPNGTFVIWQKNAKQALMLIVPIFLFLILLTVIWQANQVEEEQLERMAGITGQLVRLLLLSSASLALLIWGFDRQRWLLVSLGAAIIVIDLWGAGNKFVIANNPDQDVGWIIANEALPAERKEYRILTKVHSENSGILYGFHNVGGYDDFRTESSRRLNKMASQDARIARLLSARFLLLGKDYKETASDAPGWSLLTDLADITIYERFDIQSKGFMVHEILAAENEEDSLRLMANTNLDYTRTAVVQVVQGTSCQVSSGNPANDWVKLTIYEPERVVFQVDTASDGWLVLNDLYYPGWEVSVSGQEAAIQPTNYGLRGVCIPAGEHEIIFQFKPDIIYYGAALTGIGLVLLVTASIFIVRNNLKR